MSGDAGGQALATTANRFGSLIGRLTFRTTESETEHKALASFTLANLFVRCTVNGLTAGSKVVTSRINRVNGNLTVSFAAGVTGLAEDLVNTDALVDGNEFNAILTGGNGAESVTFTIEAATLQHASSDIPLLGATPSSTVNFGAGTRFFGLMGEGASGSAEAAHQYIFRVAATLSKMMANVPVSSTNGDYTYKSRKNTADGAQTVTITAGVTGQFEDTVNTDAIAAGDVANTTVIPGGTAGGIELRTSQMQSAAVGRQMAATRNASNNVSSDVYLAAEGIRGQSATQAHSQKTARTAFVAKNLFVRVGAHGASSGVDIDFQQNDVDSALDVTIAASTTGTFEDTTDTVTMAAADRYDYFLNHGGGAGSISCTIIGFELAQPAAGAASPKGQFTLLGVGA